MTSKIQVFNGALRMCGERSLASLTENREPRRLLDEEWADGALDYCLGLGQWRFGRRTVEIAASTSIVPDFGYSKAFDIPTDHIRTVSLCSDPYQKVPLLAYTVETAYWFADLEPLYVTYISNDASFGGDISRWPAEFNLVVQSYLATKIVEKLTQDDGKHKKVFQLHKTYKLDAASSDAMEGPTVFPPPGTWTSARLGRAPGRRDRGNRSSLTGG